MSHAICTPQHPAYDIIKLFFMSFSKTDSDAPCRDLIEHIDLKNLYDNTLRLFC